MAKRLGHIGLKRKRKHERPVREPPHGSTTLEIKRAYNEIFMSRTRLIIEQTYGRRAQGKVAAIFGMTQSDFKQYITRTPLPHYLIPAFAAHFGITIEWLFTGRQRAKNK